MKSFDLIIIGGGAGAFAAAIRANEHKANTAMINAGLPITSCLSILAEQTTNSFLAKVIVDVQKDVEAGQALSTSMAKHPKAFSTMFVSMVRAGEASGVL
ncbi:hypothetical protein LCGC14_2073000, partial [marine sediment metagenome]